MSALWIGLALVSLGVALIVSLPALWRLHRPRPEGVTQQWLSEHDYDKNGDRR